jgi:hypothetical protein
VVFHRAMSKVKTLGRCRLCGAHGELRDSHIIPNWAYRRIQHVQQQTVLVTAEVAVHSTKQITDRLLCDACEHRFQPWETVVAELAWQEDDTFPALDGLRPTAVRDDNVNHLVADGSSLGPELGRFALSVLWRAGVSGKFEDVELGPYGELLQSYLLGDCLPAPEGISLGVHLLEPTPGYRLLDRTIAPPCLGERKPTHRCYHFIVPGLYFWCYVGKMLPTGSLGYCFLRTSKIMIGAHDQIVPGIARLFSTSVPKGKYARHLRR